MIWAKDAILLSDDKKLVDVVRTHQLLSETYWGVRRPIEVVEKMIETSLCFTLLEDNIQIGFGRAVTDTITLSWIADIVILPEYRGKGIGKWMMECILEHPDISQTQKILQTRDAHEYYKKFDFETNPALMSTAVKGL
jgi:GNAT superfamily N-acetyltransferase